MSDRSSANTSAGSAGKDARRTPGSEYIRTHVTNGVGVIELDRPKALNSLTHGMICAIDAALTQWEHDDAVRLILLRSTSERAYCAGGDVRYVREHDAAGDYQPGDDLFRDEYRMNAHFAAVAKPIIALLEGVVMGGGMGISAHGSHRIITPRTLGAMPETAIGFVPDVGMTHVLGNLVLNCEPDGEGESVDPLAIGVFIAATGWRLSPADMLYTGISTHVVAQVEEFYEAVLQGDLRTALQQCAARDGGAEWLEQPSRIRQHAALISHIFGAPTWAEVMNRLEMALERAGGGQAAEATGAGAGSVLGAGVADSADLLVSGGDATVVEFLTEVREALAAGNPESLVATFEIVRRASQLDLQAALENEYRVGSALRRRPNFPEGVRAVLVDKDRQPAFDPARVEDVDVEYWRGLLH